MMIIFYIGLIGHKVSGNSLTLARVARSFNVILTYWLLRRLTLLNMVTAGGYSHARFTLETIIFLLNLSYF